jgi:site-specific DNA-methyltransferase (adenine-specific)
MKPYYEDALCRLYHGDAREVVPLLEDRFTALVSDPPYGLSFMGKDWDSHVPGEAFWRAFSAVLLPGAPVLAFGGTRTFHRLMIAIEDAGLELRDTLLWIYGGGFPKSLDVSKAIDKAAGITRPRVPGGVGTDAGYSGGFKPGEAISGEAIKWQGYGTALKPAWEPIILARKPIEGTVAANVQKYGTGAMNIDGGRVQTNEVLSMIRPGRNPETDAKAPQTNRHDEPFQYFNNKGRFPANLIHDGSEEVVGGFPITHGPGNKKRVTSPNGKRGGNTNFLDGCREPYSSDLPMLYGKEGGGSTSRFFYCAKADKGERERGCGRLENRRSQKMSGDNFESMVGHERKKHKCTMTQDRFLRNNHPTVKPLALMRYLLTLVQMPEINLVLDPFAGSGTTGVAATELGIRSVLIELDESSCEIAAARLSAAPLGLL